MAAVIGWRAWYDGRLVFDSKTTAWEDLPADGVVSIVLYEDSMTPAGHPTRQVMEGSSFYFRAPGAHDFIYGHNEGPAADIQRRYPGAIVVLGKWVDGVTLEQIQTAAMTAREL